MPGHRTLKWKYIEMWVGGFFLTFFLGFRTLWEGGKEEQKDTFAKQTL